MYQNAHHPQRRLFKMCRSRIGFAQSGITAVELLVVIAIISFLVALLIPSLRRARVQARLAKCQSNLKASNLAWHEYLVDHGGSFLRGLNADINYGGQQGTLSSFQRPKPLNPYVSYNPVTYQEIPAFSCPADRGVGASTEPARESYGSSYRMNVYLVGQDPLQELSHDPCVEVIKELNKVLPGIKRSRIFNESGLLLMGDIGWRTTSFFNSKSFAPSWHGKSQHYSMLFMDGHADFVRIRKGIYVDSRYSLIPFQGLRLSFENCQKEVLGPQGSGLNPQRRE